MDNIQINAYITSAINLVRSMVIKIDEIGVRDNEILVKAGYPTYADKRKWRYYLNLNGEYHSTDTPMKIISLDNNEEIIFSKSVLEDHPITLEFYKDRDYRYKRLVEAYPAQQELINGILDPIDIDEAIASPNYKILRYNSKFVNSNETQLIPELQKFIDAFCFQHFKTEYMMTDVLMLPVLIGELYAKVIPLILEVRKEAVGTRYAHEFHIWSHINSYGDFFKYKDLLNEYQVMYLYRNISWLVRHSGKKYTFEKILENILTKRLIPLSHYDFMFDTTDQIENITPEVSFLKTNLNLINLYSDVKDKVDNEYIIRKELPLARDNEEFQDVLLGDLEDKGVVSLQGEIPTKVYHSKMVDYTDRHEDTLLRVLHNQAVYLSYKGLYDTYVNITDPLNGKHYKLHIKEAITLWKYLTDLMCGITCKDVQPVLYNRALKVVKPDWTELKKFGPEKYIWNDMCKDIVNLGINYTRIISPKVLYTTSEKCLDILWKYKKMYSQFYDFRHQAYVKRATEEMLTTGYCYLTNHKTYESFLNEIEFDLEDHGYDDYSYLSWELFKAFTGYGLFKHISTRETQSGLINLMLELSSYTIHVITEIDDGTGMVEDNTKISVSPGSDIQVILETNNVALGKLPFLDPKIISNLDVDLVGQRDLLFLPSFSLDTTIKLEQITGLKDVTPDKYPNRILLPTDIYLVDNTSNGNSGHKTNP